MKKSIISIILVFCMLFPMAAAVGVQAGDASSTAGALDNYSAADAGIDVYTAWYNTANHFTPDGNKKLDVFISAKEDRNKLPSKILVTNLKSNTSYLNAVQAWKYATFNDDTASDIFTDKEKAVYVSLLHDMIMGDDAVSGYNAIVSDTGEKIGETWENISEEGLRDFLNYLLASNLLEKYLGNKNTIEELENLLKTATDAETKQDIANAIDTVQKQNKGMATANAFLSSPVWEKIDIATNNADSALTLFDTCARLADVYALMNCDQAYFDVMKGISQSSTASDKVRAAAAEIAEVRKNYNIDKSSIMQYVFQDATKDFIIEKTTSAVYDLVLDKIKELFPAFAVWDGARVAGKFCCDFLFDTTDQNAILYSMLALDEIETALYDTTENGWTEFLMNPSVENAQFFNTAMRLIYRYHIASEQYAQQYIDSIYKGGLIPLLFSNKEDYATWTDSLTDYIWRHKRDLYLYDAWVWDTYTTYAEKLYIVYSANGGSNPPTAQMTRYEKDVALTTDIPTRTGYTFLGWSLTDNGTAQYIPGQTYAFETSVTLYAVWEKDAESTSVPSTFDDAKAMVDFSSTAIGATKGRIRYMTQLPSDTACYVSDYWKYTVNGTTGTLSSSDKCTRCALSMTLSYLGLDYTPGYMSTLANSINIDSPWVTVPALIPSITRVNGAFDTLFANYSASSDHSPIAVYFKHLDDGDFTTHAIVIIGKNGDTYYAVDSAANVTKLVELTFNADKTAIATCSYACYADTSTIMGFAQWKLNGTPDPDPDPDPEPETFTLTGTIRNATADSAEYGNGIAGVSVTCKKEDGTIFATTTTAADGTFSITFTEEGKYLFVLEKAGFQSFTTAALNLTKSSPSIGIFTMMEEETEAEIIASGTCGDNLTWTLDDAGTLTISGEGEMKDYSNTDTGYPWNDYINPSWTEQQDLSGIKKAVLCEGVTTLASEAFVQRRSRYSFRAGNVLENIQLPETLDRIEDYAFRECNKLTNITIPKSVSYIAYTAFIINVYGTASLQNIYVDAENEDFCDIGGVLCETSSWTGDIERIIRCPSLNSTTIFEIPSTVTYIVPDAFSGCKNLEHIVFVENNNTSLGITIGRYAFQDCINLQEMYLPQNLSKISPGCFEGCSSIEKFQISEKNEYFYTDENGVLYTKDVSELIQYPAGNSTLSAFTVPDTVTTIRSGAFSSASYLESITIPDTFTEISEGMFWDCTGLKYFTIPASVTSIESCAFLGCSSLQSITIPETVASIGDSAFFGCSSLKSFIIPETVTSIGDSVFLGCISLESITIPKTVTSIGDSFFYGCSSLKSFIIPETVTSIGDSVFSDCSSLESITIPETVTSIGDRVFNKCSSLKTINLPSKLTSIGEWTFANCSALTTITIPDSVTSIGGYAFQYCKNLSVIHLPTSLVTIPAQLFMDCISLTSIEIPENVAALDRYAFDNCTSLTSVYFYGDAPTIATNTFKNTPSSLILYYIDGKSGWTTPTWNGYNTATFTPGAVEPDPVPGDIDGNGTVDYFDVTALYAAYQSGEVDSTAMDVNGDGSVDYYDVSKLYAVFRGTAVLP